MNTFQGAAVYSAHDILLQPSQRWMSSRSCLGRRHPQWAAQPVQSQPDTPEHAEPGISGAGHRPSLVLCRPQQG